MMYDVPVNDVNISSILKFYNYSKMLRKFSEEFVSD